MIPFSEITAVDLFEFQGNVALRIFVMGIFVGSFFNEIVQIVSEKTKIHP
jgi:hypothetical protein